MLLIKILKPDHKCLRFTIKFRRYTNLSYIHNQCPEPLRPLTIGKLLENTVQKYGDRPAIISRSQNQKMTFLEVLNQADKLAAGFRAIGLNRGDHVGIWAPNILEWYITHMACARGGFVLVNINPAYEPQELKSCVNSVGVKALVCTHKSKHHDYYENLIEISPELVDGKPGKLMLDAMPSLRSVIVQSDISLRGTFNYEHVLNVASEGDVKNIRKLQEFIDPDSLCHLQFTSGTTGKPKVPMDSHFQIVNNSYFAGKRNELDRKHHVVCGQNPLFHAMGTVLCIGAALNFGSTLVLPAAGYDPDKSLDAIRDERCTVIIGTPTMYVDLVNRQKARNEDISPEIAVTAGANCSPHLFNEMKDILKLRKVKSIYGSTETTAVVFQSLFDDDEYQSTSTVGYVSEHLEVKVVNEQGYIVPRGTTGELCVRGYTTTSGYWQDEEKTRELIGRDRWLRTGDQFIMEQNGYGRVVGRLKEMIIRGGENIYPIEIEDHLNTHPAIVETYVIGIQHERLGEEVCACVRLKPDAALTLDEIKSYCKGKLAHFKIPSRLEIVESFPKTTSGKIQKSKLAETIIKK